MYVQRGLKGLKGSFRNISRNGSDRDYSEGCSKDHLWILEVERERVVDNPTFLKLDYPTDYPTSHLYAYYPSDSTSLKIIWISCFWGEFLKKFLVK